jgi:hypothetical protein
VDWDECFVLPPKQKEAQFVLLYMEAVMNISNRMLKRLPMLIGCAALILSMLACAVLNGSPQPQDASAQVDNGVIKVKMASGEWVPLAGESTFTLEGKIENTNPWTVAGRTLSTNAATKIDEGLQTGDLVRVQGTVLENDTWLAYSMERTEQQGDPTVVLVGVVDSVNPWVVNGIQLNVTDGTEIEGDVKPGMIVRVVILLLNDGTWEVLRIAPLGEQTETSGCTTVVATVVSVEGDAIQFLGWPQTVTFSADQNANDNENDNDEDTGDEITSLSAGDTISAVVCVSSDGQLIITHITLLDKEEEGGAENNNEKVLVCHKTNKNQHTLSLPQSAVPAHLGHGDTLGACP